MGKSRLGFLGKLNFWRVLVLVFCALVTACVFYVLMFVYEPGQNSPGALASAYMDIICMVILLILVLSLLYEREKIGRTTKLFLALMLGTKWAVFFDFLTWSLDGSLKYGGWTYWFTVASLCSGSILACILVLYLYSYLQEMYGLESAHIRSRVCAILNLVAFVVTFVLALTHYAFVFENGHYQLGMFYDVITVIPILTLIYMTIFAFKNVKVIGSHDAFAIGVYIFMMIAGALVEATFGVGATYVSITIADVFIFIMLQNRLLDRTKKQKEALSERISSQFEILESMAGIYSYVNYIDFEELTAQRFDQKDSIGEKLNIVNDPHTGLNKSLYPDIDAEMKDSFWKFTNLSTLPERMHSEKVITSEFLHRTEGWIRTQYIRIGETVDEPIKRVIYTIRNIDEEKKNVEKWIRRSNTDEVTGFLNRHAYEEEIASLEKRKVKDNFVYVSMDVNGLKLVNDTMGHEAGDELIVGASSCMRRCFGTYGKIYRIGGDEFVALIFANDTELESIKNEFKRLTADWSGKLIENLTISYGMVTYKEAEGMSLHQIAVLADKRMYENKTKYYQKKGVDRRGQRDAHVALCALYTKVLKVNVSKDTFQIVNADHDELTAEKGYADTLSAWIDGFAKSGGVHPDDLDEYYAKANIQYVSEYFRQNNSLLRITYRRKYEDGYRKVMMEMIPAGATYSDTNQNLFLYVKEVE